MTLARDPRLDPRAEAHPDARARTEDPRRRDVWESRTLARSIPIPGLDSLEDRRAPVAFGQHVYRLQQTDVATLRTVGTFRAVYADDLRHDHPGLDRDLRTLREQGLVTVTHLQRPDTRATVDVLSLTPAGRRLVEAAEPGDQRYHSEVVRLREVHHDAQLWRVYHQHLQQLEARGATVERVRLDHELKRALWSHADQSTSDPAVDLGLPRDANGHVSIPDMQVVVREPDGTITRANLELVTRHYSSASLRAKAAAGFTLYDENSVRGPGDDPDRAARLLDW